ncbi:MAG TPA: ATP-binding cassette domain-containing protein, partial [Candidatus Cloacimonadota bacterium]|nr:ATP-binding cassette domain-containing protein [Candidatus Cloacimonadota bacterium]
RDINFEIEKGKTLAICGRTASGKSSIVDLLVRVYNPPKGAIFIDGQEIYNIPLELLRKSIVMVPQDVFLFSDTIANNIALGKPNASLEEIHNAAKYAAIYDEILEFNQGFDTIVGERGVTLSGGQKQRVAIARSLVTDPEILILDDALSAVDTKTENQILNHLINVRSGKTTIIIAHRISALHQADKILVLQKQTIVESGSHDELLALNGAYHDLYEKQKIQERLEGKE